MPTEITDECKEKMSEWVELKRQLGAIKEDVKVLNAQEKTLKEYIKIYMKDQGIDNINLRKGKVSYKQSKRKPGMTKDTVESGLRIYFNGDETAVEGALNCIIDYINTSAVTSEVVSLTGLKD